MPNSNMLYITPGRGGFVLHQESHANTRFVQIN